MIKKKNNESAKSKIELQSSNQHLRTSNQDFEKTYSKLHQANQEIRYQQQRIKQSERNYRTILNNTIQGFILLDNNYKIVTYNQTAIYYYKKILGKALLGNRTILKLFSKNNIESFYSAFNKAIQGQNNQAEFEFTDKDNQKRFFRFNFTPVIDDPNTHTVEQISLSFIDITDQRQAEHTRDRYQSLLDKTNSMAKVGGWEANVKTSEAFWSTQIYHIYGLEPSKTKPPPVHQAIQYYPKKDRARLAKILDLSIKNQTEQEGEFRLIDAKKNLKWVRIACSPKKNDKTHQWLIGSIADITDLKQREEELNQQKKHLHYVLNAIPHWIWTMDITGKITYVNQPMLKNFPQFTNLKRFNRIRSIVADEDSEEFNAQWETSLKTLTTFSKDHKISIDGSNLWVQTTILPIKRKDKILEWLGSMTDIHDKKTLENQKDEFLAFASHELKTPLTTIKSYIDLMAARLDKLDRSTFSRYISKSQKGVDKLHNLINELLDLNRITIGHLSLELEEVEIDKLLKQIIANAKRHYPNANLIQKLKSNAIIYADKDRIEQVIMNLISNAVKYSTRQPQIQISSKQSNNQITIQIKDNGIGIKKKDQSHLFERFYRSDNIPKKTSGMGIGLYITKQIMDLHEASIVVDSTYGEGSTFSIHFKST